MLTTKKNYEMETLSTQETKSWRAIDLELGVPYAFITHTVKEDQLLLATTTILWIDDDVISFCQAIRNDRMRKLASVGLFLPLDNSKNTFERRWVSVKEIWSRRVTDSVEIYPVYISMQDERIGERHGERLMTTKRNAELLFRQKSG